MSVSYWQKKDLVKKYIATHLRLFLMRQYEGLPVIVLRNLADKIKADNKVWVNKALKHFDCEEISIKWQTYFDYQLDENNTAIISDFEIIIDTI